MKSSRKLNDAVALEHYRVVLSKTETYPKIALALERFGYGPAILQEGREVLEETRKIYEDNIRKRDELSFVRVAFTKQKREVDRTFRDHRNKAMLLFRNDEVSADFLALNGKYPRRYHQWLETARLFYTGASANREIQERLMRFRLTADDIGAAQAGIEALEQLYADRMLLKGVSEDSTEKKREAFDRLHEWMSEFFGAARLALKREPELLEALVKPS